MVALHAKFGQILRSFFFFEILKLLTHKICPVVLHFFLRNPLEKKFTFFDSK